MKNFLLIFAAILFTQPALAQRIDWSEDYSLQPSDFKATAPNTGSAQTIMPHCVIEYSLMNYELIFSKNFNKNVSCYFLSTSSWLDSGNSTNKLLSFAQVIFDINELAARKIRKRFLENKKKLNLEYNHQIYTEVMQEITGIESLYAKETNFGNNEEEQKKWEQKIDYMLAEYESYCKTCKAPKKKKKK